MNRDALKLSVRFASTLTFAASLVMPLCAQTTTPPITQTPDWTDLAALTAQGQTLLEKARAGSGSSGITLQEYDGHHTMLTARTRSGGAELHEKFADFLIVLDGEGTEMLGGTIADRKELPGGEVHGSTLVGATAHPLKKGDILHIPAGTPHQSIEAPGQSLIVFVIKVQVPTS